MKVESTAVHQSNFIHKAVLKQQSMTENTLERLRSQILLEKCKADLGCTTANPPRNGKTRLLSQARRVLIGGEVKRL